jgi:hypothetical protein
MYVWSRFLPANQPLVAAADQELTQLGQLLANDPAKQFQLAAFAMMSYAERLSPGRLYRTERAK